MEGLGFGVRCSSLIMDNLNRYARNIALPQLGADGQRRICAGRVLLVGCGALGSAAGMYLAGSGVGTLGLADFDTVDVSNLQRQVAYTEGDAGRGKVTALAARLRALNSAVTVREHPVLVTPVVLNGLLGDYDVVADCSDNPATKHFLAKACTRAGKPCVTAGVAGFVAQVTTALPDSPSFSDIFGDWDESCPANSSGNTENGAGDAPGNGVLPCAVSGVFGPAAGVAATLQAAEVLKLLGAFGTPLVGRLMLIDTLSMHAHVYTL